MAAGRPKQSGKFETRELLLKFIRRCAAQRIRKSAVAERAGIGATGLRSALLELDVFYTDKLTRPKTMTGNFATREGLEAYLTAEGLKGTPRDTIAENAGVSEATVVAFHLANDIRYSNGTIKSKARIGRPPGKNERGPYATRDELRDRVIVTLIATNSIREATRVHRVSRAVILTLMEEANYSLTHSPQITTGVFKTREDLEKAVMRLRKNKIKEKRTAMYIASVCGVSQPTASAIIRRYEEEDSNVTA